MSRRLVMNIPSNCWGSFSYNHSNCDTSFKIDDHFLTSKGNYDIQRIQVNSHWWSNLPSRIFSKTLLSAWNSILFQFGYVTVNAGTKPVEIKVSELRDKLLLDPELLRKAAMSGETNQLISTQINHLNQLHHTGKIDISAEEWAENVMKVFCIDKDKNYTETLISIHLIPEQAEYYKKLQYKIAEKVPNEWDRPTIEVEISNPGVNPTYTCCIGGGVGPLSDAEILSKAIEKITDPSSWKESRIVLYSAPSPMRGINQLQNFPKLFPWWGRIQQFLTRWYKSYKDQTTTYILASNTVHVHMPKLKLLAKEHLLNIVELIAKGIKQKSSQTDEVFILGTTEAHTKKLYPKVFSENQVNFKTVDDRIQDVLQVIINHTKQNKLNDADKETLKDLLANIKRMNPKFLLLGCTELPLALKQLNGNIEQELYDNGITVIDTEEVIAWQIALNIMHKSKPGEEKNAMEHMLSML